MKPGKREKQCGRDERVSDVAYLFSHAKNGRGNVLVARIGRDAIHRVRTALPRRGERNSFGEDINWNNG